MKKILFLFLSVTFIMTVSSCSKDDDKADVNFITAKFNGVEERFTIISVILIDYDTYTDVVVRATPNSEPAKIVTIASEFGITGANIIWGFYYKTPVEYFEIDSSNFTSTVTSNSNGNYAGTFSGSVIEENNGNVVVVTNGSFNIKY
jgi:hypothetical protein